MKVVPTRFRDLTYEQVQALYSVRLENMTEDRWRKVRGQPTAIEVPPVDILTPEMHLGCKGPFFRLSPNLIMNGHYVCVCSCVVEIGD